MFRSVTAKWLHELMCIEQQKCIKFVPIIVFERLYLAMYKINYAIYFVLEEYQAIFTYGKQRSSLITPSQNPTHFPTLMTCHTS